LTLHALSRPSRLHRCRFLSSPQYSLQKAHGNTSGLIDPMG
jgi:hypothetical protein